MKTLRSLLRLNSGSDSVSIFEQLKRDNIPVIMWGAGNVAVHTMRTLQKKGIELSGIWVDGSTSGELNGVPIRSYEQIAAQFNKFNVVCGHSRFDLAEEAEQTRKEINRIFCSVNAFYEDSDIMTSEFIEEHYSEYERSFELLEDDFSRQCFAAYMNCRNNDDYTMLLPCYVDLRTGGGAKESYFHNPFFNAGDSEVYLDVGAYNGDSVRAFVEATGGKYRKILAVEPEQKNFAELEKYVRESNLHDVELFRNGCSDENGILTFTDDVDGEGFRANSQGTTQIEVRRIDQQFASEEITLIKINLTMGPGTVKAIRGAEKILQGKYPRMAITPGLDERGLIDIPQAVKQINPNIKLSLRYSFPMPARLLLFGY